ncbi:MAG: hypothetical protein JO235_04195 [Chroococcidiopsidaceae cyanobacterium CP_BM_RX_35]|nr:hypothetical protein [Chroococcidiopsidaceae cyanobacterium CP_BM_RX_35]
MEPILELPWCLVACASNFSYSSLERLYLDYQFACFKFGLAPYLHVRISRIATDEFRLCVSLKLAQLVDENLDAFTRPSAHFWNDLPLTPARIE